MQDWEVAARVPLPCEVSAEGRALDENLSSRPTPMASVRKGRWSHPKAPSPPLHHPSETAAAALVGRAWGWMGWRSWAP